MSAWKTLGRAAAPGGGELELAQRGDELAIRVDGTLLMSSGSHGSEEVLAELACAPLEGNPRVLVGGLGLGYTLRAVLDRLPSTGRVTLVEIGPEVVEWNRGPVSDLAGRPLDDPRLTLQLGDVAAVLADTSVPWDAVILDVDNGAAPLMQVANAGLYDDTGLARLRAAVRPGGWLAIWSAGFDETFVERLRGVGFEAEAHRVPARTGAKGIKHTIFVGQAPMPKARTSGTRKVH